MFQMLMSTIFLFSRFHLVTSG